MLTLPHVSCTRRRGQTAQCKHVCGCRSAPRRAIWQPRWASRCGHSHSIESSATQTQCFSTLISCDCDHYTLPHDSPTPRLCWHCLCCLSSHGVEHEICRFVLRELYCSALERSNRVVYALNDIIITRPQHTASNRPVACEQRAPKPRCAATELIDAESLMLASFEYRQNYASFVHHAAVHQSHGFRTKKRVWYYAPLAAEEATGPMMPDTLESLHNEHPHHAVAAPLDLVSILALL